MAGHQGSKTFADAQTAYRFVYLAQRNLALRTRKEYLTDLRQVCDYLTTQAGVRTVQAVERAHLEGFLAALDAQQLAGTTRRRKVAALRSFFLFLEDAGHRVGNPAVKLVPPGAGVEPAAVPHRTGVQALAGSCAA